MDTPFPISISEASRRLEIPKSTASIVVLTLDLPTSVDPTKPTAKLLDEAAYDSLKHQAPKFRRSASVSA